MTSDATESKLPCTTPCRLTAVQRWSRGTHLSGVVFSCGDESLELDQNFFSCCAGTGIEICDLGTKSARMCGLVGRWSFLKDLLLQISVIFPSLKLYETIAIRQGTKSTSLEHKTLDALEHWRKLHAGAMATASRGRLIADAAILAPGLSITWAAAASCIWHDGIRVFVHLHGSGPAPVAKWQRDLQVAKNLRTVIVVERVHHLFDAAKLLELDEVISFASRHQIPLWLVTDPSGKGKLAGQAAASGPDSPSGSKFSQSLNKKMSSYRHAPIEHWISPQTLGRLREVCELPVKKNDAKEFVIPPVL